MMLSEKDVFDFDHLIYIYITLKFCQTIDLFCCWLQDADVQMFAKVGFCRSHTVVVRSLLSGSLAITKSLDIEFHQVQEAVFINSVSN